MSKWKEVARKRPDGEWPKQSISAIEDARSRFDQGLTFLAQKRDFGLVLLVECLRDQPDENPEEYFTREIE